MFVPLVHPPGHAQADFGEAQVIIDGVLRKAHYLVVDLPYSDAYYVQAYPAETTEAFCDGHHWAISFFGGVPPRPSSMTTPSWQWLGFWGTGSGS
jgi:transposase